MTVVENADLPPPYFGDYPHGAYWSVAGRSDAEDNAYSEEDYSVDGSVLRIMWDEGAGPLWADGEGLLPDDPEWLQRPLGLSKALIEDLLGWQHDMDAAAQHHPPTPHLAEAAERLADRLRAEVGSRFEVRFHP